VRRATTLRRSPMRPFPLVPASEAQRAKVRGRDCLICGRKPVDPAHIVPRKHGGCDHPDCVIPLCRPCHRAYDTRNFNLWPWLHRTRRYHRELAHARAHIGLRNLRRGVSGRGWG
jgi:hypothetical protein